jgi:hypothetical protein
MFRLDVVVDIVPMLSGNDKYIAKCGSDDHDFRIDGSSMRDLLVKLANRMVELGIPFGKANIAGEFDSDELSEEDYEAWSTPLKDLVG